MPIIDYYKISKCRYCLSENLYRYISLGKQPLADSFIKESEISKEKSYPLDVYLCRSCGLSQLGIVIDPKVMFGEYAYLTSSSNALVKHYKGLVVDLTKRFKVKHKDLVVDIGCNDGSLLLEYDDKLNRLGIEPSSVASLAKKRGITVIKKFFDRKIAEQVVKKYGTAKIVTATNVFAHIDEIGKFVDGIGMLIGKTGVFVIEAPYLVDMINNNYFDTIYHEHLAYLSLTPLVPFIDSHGLSVINVERIEIGASGPALRIYVGKKNEHNISQSVKKMLSDEKKWGVKEISTYSSFARRVELLKKDLVRKIKQIKKKNQKIGGYGAPAKGNTLLNYFGIDSRLVYAVADTNKLKQGLVTPGMHIPVISEENFLEDMPQYALLLTWNYLDFFLKKSEFIKRGGKFIVPLPALKIVP